MMQEQLKTKNNVSDFSDMSRDIDIPEISRAYADFANQWYRTLPDMAIRVGNLNLEIKPEYIPATENDSRNFFFILSWQQLKLPVCLDRRMIERLLDSLHEEVDFDALADTDQALLLEYLFSPALERFEKEYTSEVSIEPYNDNFIGNSNEIVSGLFHITASDQKYPFHIAIPEDGHNKLDTIFNNKQDSNIREQLPIEELINLPLSLNYKCIETDIGTLKNLDTGDIILLGPHTTANSLMELTAGNHQLWVGKKISEQNAVEIQSIQQNTLLAANFKEYNKENSAMSDYSDSATVDDISVVLAFEVGRKDVSVRDLKDLQEGSVVSFPGEDQKEIQLVINGKEVGWGTLVKVGDDLGVKIERIFVNG